MKAVVLVGGEGTRLRPLTYDLPKPMVPILNKPFMEFQIDLMKRHQVEEVIFSMGYKWEAFEDYFGDGERFGMKLRYVVEESPLGTAGAIKNVEEYLDDEPFLVFNGDILSDMDITELIRFHNEKGAKYSIVLTPVDNPTIYGVVEHDQNLRIERFTEKPKAEEVRSNMINAGLYLLHPDILKRMEKGKKYSIEREIYPDILKNGEPMFGFHHPGYWMDIGTPLKYLNANKDLLNSKMNIPMPEFNNGIYKGEGSIISSCAHLIPPLWMGEGVVIEDGVTVVGPSVIGRETVLKENSVVVQSLLWEGITVNRDAILKECLIGRNTVIDERAVVLKLAVVGSNQHILAGEIVKESNNV